MTLTLYPLFLPTLGIGELSILFIIILILFGPGKLPDVCRALGDGLRQFKSAAKELPENTQKPTPPQE
jgi:sec-independent protein translocase protein TatA